MNRYRKELKYIVGDDVLADVRNRISAIMSIDKHQKGEYYKIRSIYFDSPDFKCYRENQAGISYRQKYRIRAYDLEQDKISAEIKIRHADTISKISADIHKDTFDTILAGDVVKASGQLVGMKNQYSDLPDKLAALDMYTVKLSGEHYMPAVIVEYDRCAYVYDIGNVRITFDRNVTASKEFEHFFDKELVGIPAIEGSKHVLEIKYDEFLPDEIAAVLSGMELKRTSCSKYVKCLEAVGIR